MDILDLKEKQVNLAAQEIEVLMDLRGHLGLTVHGDPVADQETEELQESQVRLFPSKSSVFAG